MRGINSMAKATSPGVGHLLERRLVAVRIHDGDDQRALLVGGKLVRRRAAHLQHQVGVLGDVVADAGAGGRELGVGNARRDAGAARDRDLGAERLELLDGVGRGGDPRLAAVHFTGDRYPHPRLRFGQAMPYDRPVKAKIRKQSAKAT